MKLNLRYTLFQIISLYAESCPIKIFVVEKKSFDCKLLKFVRVKIYLAIENFYNQGNFLQTDQKFHIPLSLIVVFIISFSNGAGTRVPALATKQPMLLAILLCGEPNRLPVLPPIKGRAILYPWLMRHSNPGSQAWTKSALPTTPSGCLFIIVIHMFFRMKISKKKINCNHES